MAQEVAQDRTHGTTAANNTDHLESINAANFQTGSRAYTKDTDTLWVLDKDSLQPRDVALGILWTKNSYGDDTIPGRWIEECLFCSATGAGTPGPTGPQGPTGPEGPTGPGTETDSEFDQPAPGDFPIAIPTPGPGLLFNSSGFSIPGIGLTGYVDVWVEIGANVGPNTALLGFTAETTVNGINPLPIGTGGSGISSAIADSSGSAVLIGRRLGVVSGDGVQVQVYGSASDTGAEIDAVARPTTDGLRILARFFETGS